MIKFPADACTKARCSDLKSLKTDQFAVNAFITSSVLICKVDILHY